VPFSTGVSEEEDKLERVPFRKVHGHSLILPRGYCLALLPSNANVIPAVPDAVSSVTSQAVAASLSAALAGCAGASTTFITMTR
jgi:hypothetical protein